MSKWVKIVDHVHFMPLNFKRTGNRRNIWGSVWRSTLKLSVPCHHRKFPQLFMSTKTRHKIDSLRCLEMTIKWHNIWPLITLVNIDKNSTSSVARPENGRTGKISGGKTIEIWQKILICITFIYPKYVFSIFQLKQVCEFVYFDRDVLILKLGLILDKNYKKYIMKKFNVMSFFSKSLRWIPENPT